MVTETEARIEEISPGALSLQRTAGQDFVRGASSQIAVKGVRPSSAVVKTEDRSLRVVVFTLAGHEHGIDVRRVREIIMGPRISTVLESPHFVEGVIELRGKIVPVIDLRRRLQLPEYDRTYDASVVMIAQMGRNLVGLRVDSVSEILALPTRLIEPPTDIVGGVKAGFIDGLAYVESRFLVILNVDAMLSMEEKSVLEGENSLRRDQDERHEFDALRTSAFRRIITFQLDKETYGAEIGEVAEIMEMVPIMPIPHVPPFILGLVNLRGTIVPIVDLRVRFGLERNPWTGDARIVIMRENNLVVGVAVDGMWESLRLPEESFQPAPHGVAKIDAEYFNEVCEVKGRMVIILDIKKILADTAMKAAGQGGLR